MFRIARQERRLIREDATGRVRGSSVWEVIPEGWSVLEPGEPVGDTERLEVLMRHPDKLWVDGSRGRTVYCGAAKDEDDDTEGRWYYDPRMAVDDLVRRVRAGEVEFES